MKAAAPTRRSGGGEHPGGARDDPSRGCSARARRRSARRRPDEDPRCWPKGARRGVVPLRALGAVSRGACATAVGCTLATAALCVSFMAGFKVFFAQAKDGLSLDGASKIVYVFPKQ